MTWGDGLAAWWMGEVAGDPAYAEEVVPLALDLIDPQPGERWLDLGCGEGQMMRAVSVAGALAVGCDLSPTLAAEAAASGPTVISRLPDLSWVGDGELHGAFAVLVLEHLEDSAGLFRECSRAVRTGGTLVAVLNHPVVTAVGSAPVFDQDDGEILWRWGDYFGEGATLEPAAGGQVAFQHRSVASLLNQAADAGWSLQRVVERGAGEGQADRDPLLALQRNVPRLLGVRWSSAG